MFADLIRTASQIILRLACGNDHSFSGDSANFLHGNDMIIDGQNDAVELFVICIVKAALCKPLFRKCNNFVVTKVNKIIYQQKH